jgi:WD40 repeat protein
MGTLGVAVAIGLLAWAVGGGAHAEPMGAKREPWAQRLDSQLLAQGSVQAGRRSALVIGNGAYPEERLANAVNDAEAVARTLEEVGFSVKLVRNGDKRTIEDELEAFSRRLVPGEIGLFYFSGHGVQVEGENYLVPVNAQLNRQTDTQYDAVPLGKVISKLETSSATSRIIVLDACRNNPFYRRWPSTARGGATRGLATPLTSGSAGTFIAFSTAPGKEAADGIGNGPNSPFTTHLLRHLRTPNLEVANLFRRVRNDVMQATSHKQIPWVSEALVGEVYLNPQSPISALAEKPELPNPAPTRPRQETAPVQPDQGTSRSLRYSLQGHSKAVNAVAFSPDGLRIVSGSFDNTLRLWDAVNGQSIGSPLEAHTDPVLAVAVSHDGKYIISGSLDGTIRIWDGNNGRVLGPAFKGHSQSVGSLAFKPNGRQFASGSAHNLVKMGGELLFWDIANSTPYLSLPKEHEDGILSLAFSQDGKFLITGGADGLIFVRSVITGNPILPPLRGHSKRVYSVSLSFDGRMIASASADGSVRLWDLLSGKQVGKPLTGHKGWVQSVSFSPDGRRIVSGSRDRTLRIWDPKTGKQIGNPLQGHLDYVSSVAFSPDGRKIISGSWDGTLRLWDAETGAPHGFPP